MDRCGSPRFLGHADKIAYGPLSWSKRLLSASVKRMGEEGVVQDGIGQSTQHGHLHDGQDFAAFHAQNGRSQNLPCIGGGRHVPHPARFAGPQRTPRLSAEPVLGLPSLPF